MLKKMLSSSMLNNLPRKVLLVGQGLRLSVLHFTTKSKLFYLHQSVSVSLLSSMGHFFSLVGLPFQDMPRSQTVALWLAVKVDADCSKLTVSGGLMLCRSPDVPLPGVTSSLHLASVKPVSESYIWPTSFRYTRHCGDVLLTISNIVM